MLRGVLFARSPDAAYRHTVKWMGALDRFPVACETLGGYLRGGSLPVTVGSVVLPFPLVLAAGLVKGHGFASEKRAVSSVSMGRNVIPGWRSVPALLGPVEMGSFTFHPRLGNPGRVLKRDGNSRNLFNRVGLRNPGSAAAALFLANHADALPPVYGISIAPDPDVGDTGRQHGEIAEATRLFVEAGVRPSWVTVNSSCPNTPHQQRKIEEQVFGLCKAVKGELPTGVALWVKIPPGMEKGRYGAVAQAAVEGGAETIIATNAAMSTSGGAVSGEALFPHALRAVMELDKARCRLGLGFNIVGCGGVLNGEAYQEYLNAGAVAVQYLAALVFRGPSAPGLILRESGRVGKR